MATCKIAGGARLQKAPYIVDARTETNFKSALCQIATTEDTIGKVHLLKELINDIRQGNIVDVNLEHDGTLIADLITGCHVDLQVDLSELLLCCIKSVNLDVGFIDERRGIVSTPALLKFYEPLHASICRNLLPNVAAGQVCCQFYCHLLATCSSLDAFENLTLQFNRILRTLIGDVDVNESPGELPTEDARVVIGIMKTLLNITKSFGSPPAPFELLRDMATNVICATNVHMCRLYSYNLIAFLLRKSPGREQLQAALPGLKLAQVDQIYALLKEANHGNDDDAFEYSFLYTGIGAAIGSATVAVRASVAATGLNSGACSTKVAKSDSVAPQTFTSSTELHIPASTGNLPNRPIGVQAPKAKGAATDDVPDTATSACVVFRGEWVKLLEKQFNKVGNDATNYDREAWKQKQKVLNQIIDGVELASKVQITNTIQQLADVLSTALKNECAIPIVQGLLRLFCLLQQSSEPNLVTGCKSMPLCEHLFEKLRQSNKQILNWAMVAVGLVIKNNLDCGILDLVKRTLESKSPQAKEAMCNIISGDAPLLKNGCHVALHMQPHKQDIVATLQVLSSDKTPKVRSAAALAIKAMKDPGNVDQKYFTGNIKRPLDEGKAGVNDGKAGLASNLATRALKRRVLKQNFKTASESDAIAVATQLDTRLASLTATAVTTARTTAVITPKITSDDTHTPVAPPVATPVAERRAFVFDTLAPIYTSPDANTSRVVNSLGTVATTRSIAQQQQQVEAQDKTICACNNKEVAAQLLSTCIDANVLEQIASGTTRGEGIQSLCSWIKCNKQQASKVALPILEHLHLHTSGFTDQTKGVFKTLYALLAVIIELELNLEALSFITRAMAKQVSLPKATLILQRLLELYDCNVIWDHVFQVCDATSATNTLHALVEIVNFQCRNFPIAKILSHDTRRRIINWLCDLNTKGTLVDASFQTLQLLTLKLGLYVVVGCMDVVKYKQLSQALAASTDNVNEPLEASTVSTHNTSATTLDAWSQISCKFKHGYASACLGLEPEISKDLYLCMFQRGNINNLKRACVFWRVFIKQGSPKCFKMLYDVNNVRLEFLIWSCHTLLSRVAERVLLDILALIAAGLQQHQLFYSVEEAQLLIYVLCVYKGTLEPDAIDAMLQCFPRDNRAVIEIVDEQLAQCSEDINEQFISRLKSWLDLASGFAQAQEGDKVDEEPRNSVDVHKSPEPAALNEQEPNHLQQQQQEEDDGGGSDTPLHTTEDSQEEPLNKADDSLGAAPSLEPTNTIEASQVSCIEPTVTVPLDTLDSIDGCTSQTTNTNDDSVDSSHTSGTRISCSSNITIDSIGCQQDVEDGSLENNLQELIESCTRLSWEIQSVGLADQNLLGRNKGDSANVDANKRKSGSFSRLVSCEVTEAPYATRGVSVQGVVEKGSVNLQWDKTKGMQVETAVDIDQCLGLLPVTNSSAESFGVDVNSRENDQQQAPPQGIFKEQTRVFRNIVVPTAYSISETMQHNDDDHLYGHIADGSSQMDSVASRGAYLEAGQLRVTSDYDKGTARQDFILAQVGWLVCKCSWLANICLLTRYDDYKQLVTNIYDKGLVETCSSTTAAILAWTRASFANRILEQVAPLVIDVCHVAILRLCRHVEIITSDANAETTTTTTTTQAVVVAIAQLLQLFYMVILPFQQQTQLHFCAIVIHCLALPKGCFSNCDLYNQLTQLIRATCTSINIQALSQVLLCSLELTTKSMARGEGGRFLLALLRFTRILQMQLLERLKTARVPPTTLAKLQQAHSQLVKVLEPPRKSCTLEKKITDTLVTTQVVLRSIQS